MSYAFVWLFELFHIKSWLHTYNKVVVSFLQKRSENSTNLMLICAKDTLMKWRRNFWRTKTLNLSKIICPFKISCRNNDLIQSKKIFLLLEKNMTGINSCRLAWKNFQNEIICSKRPNFKVFQNWIHHQKVVCCQCALHLIAVRCSVKLQKFSSFLPLQNVRTLKSASSISCDVRRFDIVCSKLNHA